jgi:hypothetical protein
LAKTTSHASPHPDPGCLPAWGEAEIPAPPRFNARNAIRLIGPAAIALGTAIGSGEWLLGPAVTAKYGAALLWIASLSIILQVILNQEMMRYTIATGEPIFTGILRTRPGPVLWGPLYTVLLLLQIGWPGWAYSAATAISSAFKGSLTTQTDRPTILIWGYLTFILSLLIIALGGKVEKTLERVQWIMIGLIMSYLIVIGLFFVSATVWVKVWGGFLGLGGRPLPSGDDWFLLTSFAAVAGMGGLGNGTLSNWVRDKGWGMASTVGYIAGMIGGKAVPLSRVGKLFSCTEENVSRFREWMKFVQFEQVWVFGLGCFLGMGLPALMTVQFVPAEGVDLLNKQQWAAAAFQAEGLRQKFGQIAWFLTLMNGFWILFSTQLGNTDIFARTVTDMLWSTHPSIQRAARGDVRRVYFTVLLGFALFGMVAMQISQPGFLVVLSSFIAAFNFVVIGTHTLIVQKRFLPPELRMSRWREYALYFFICLFTALTFLGIRAKWNDIVSWFGR